MAEAEAVAVVVVVVAVVIAIAVVAAAVLETLMFCLSFRADCLLRNQNKCSQANYSFASSRRLFSLFVCVCVCV